MLKLTGKLIDEQKLGEVIKLSFHYEKVATWQEQQHLAAILVCKRTNVFYFSGFSGSAGVLVLAGAERKLFVDFRYIEQAMQTAPDFEVVRSVGSPIDAAVAYLLEKNFQKIGFEGDFLTVSEFARLSKKIDAGCWQSVELDSLRAVKTAAEIAKIGEAAKITDQAFEKILPLVRPGETERALAAKLEYEMRLLGSERTAFESIIASGPRGALPHGTASDRVLETGDFVVFDFGAVVEGYHSDMTRTVCLGKASERQRQLYAVVLEAQLAGLKAVVPGALCRQVDLTARQIIVDAGFGEFFGHGLGHCVGLAIHENPRLSPLAGEARLEPGMVVTVEPGIYLPGWGGVRIEDLVVVTEAGPRILSRTGKELLELA